MKLNKTNNMKRYLIIFALLLGAVCSFGQSKADQAAVVQKCMMAPQVSQHLKFDPTGVPVSLYVVQGQAVLPADLDVDYFGRKVEIVTLPEILRKNAPAYFSFNRLDVRPDGASISFDLTCNDNTGKNVIQYTIELQKAAGVWNISDTKTTGR